MYTYLPSAAVLINQRCNLWSLDRFKKSEIKPTINSVAIALRSLPLKVVILNVNFSVNRNGSCMMENLWWSTFLKSQNSWTQVRHRCT